VKCSYAVEKGCSLLVRLEMCCLQAPLFPACLFIIFVVIYPLSFRQGCDA
jgi:hypothetical protein